MKFWRRYEHDRKIGNFWRRYGNDRPSSSCKHLIRIDRSGSYQIVVAMRWPRTQLCNPSFPVDILHFFGTRWAFVLKTVGLFSESVPSFEARSWQGVAMRHKEEQSRAAASLLVLLIVAQALLLLLFKALYSTSASDQELSTTGEKSCSRYLEFFTERKGNNLFRLSSWIFYWAGRGRCVEFLDKALYSHCPKEKPSH